MTDDDGLTVGEWNSMHRITRSMSWLVVFYTTFIFTAYPALMVVLLYQPPTYTPGSLWRVPVIMLWSLYLTAVGVVWQYMSLFMPHAPHAVQEAIVKVGLKWTGFPTGIVILMPVVCFGKVWMLVTTACVFRISIAGVFAFWKWLVRAYPKNSN